MVRRRRGGRTAAIVGVALGLTLGIPLALGGCGGGSESIASAKSILAHAKAQAPHDAAFSITLTVTAGDGSGPLTETGSGSLTTNPYRQDITVTGTTDGLTITTELVTDGQTLYARAPGSDTWQQTSADASARFLSYDLTAPELVGQEKMGGAMTWHIQGRLSPTSTTDTEDLWLRQDNALPVRVTLHAVSAAGASVTAELRFTKWNTGASITPPTPAPSSTPSPTPQG